MTDQIERIETICDLYARLNVRGGVFNFLVRTLVTEIEDRTERQMITDTTQS